MATGSVKFFNAERGYGFIVRDRGGDIFVHITNVAEGDELRQGDRVRFDERLGRRRDKLEAFAVAIIEPTTEPNGQKRSQGNGTEFSKVVNEMEKRERKTRLNVWP